MTKMNNLKMYLIIFEYVRWVKQTIWIPTSRKVTMNSLLKLNNNLKYLLTQGMSIYRLINLNNYNSNQKL